MGVSWAAFGCSWGPLGGRLGSSGVLLGPLRGLLGSSGGLLGACWGRLWGGPTSEQPRPGFLVPLLELLGALLASSLVHVFFEVVFFSSSKLLGTSLVSTADLPRFENKVFSALAS